MASSTWLNSTCLPPPDDVTGWRFQYEDKDGKQMFAYAAKPANHTGKIPGVMVFHAWEGAHEPFTYEKAHLLAQQGYLALIPDLFGEPETLVGDARPAAMKEAHAGEGRFRMRVSCGFDQLMGLQDVDVGRVGAIGYCLGGKAAIELARMNPGVVRGVVTYHAVLAGDRVWSKEKEEKAGCKLLIYHGWDDPMVPQNVYEDFIKEMTDNKVDCEVVVLPGQVHSFTRPDKVGAEQKEQGQQYHEYYAKRAWDGTILFLRQLLTG